MSKCQGCFCHISNKKNTKKKLFIEKPFHEAICFSKLQNVTKIRMYFSRKKSGENLGKCQILKKMSESFRKLKRYKKFLFIGNLQETNIQKVQNATPNQECIK